MLEGPWKLRGDKAGGVKHVSRVEETEDIGVVGVDGEKDREDEDGGEEIW